MDYNHSKTEIYEDNLSIIIIGDQYVGKTSLMKRFTENSFNENTLGTVGIECYRKIHYIKQSKYLVKIWDTCGQEQFRSLTANYFRNAEGVILAYDVTEEISFISLQNWLKSLHDNCLENIPKIIIGNKVDNLNKAINTKKAKSFADINKVKLFEASAKNDLNVKEAFDSLLQDIIKLKNMNEVKRDSIRISYNKDDNQSKCKC